jgi:hypothetical protein
LSKNGVERGKWREESGILVERGKWNFSGERKVERGEWDLYWREGF